MGRGLIYVGLLLVAVGFAWPWLSRFPWGHLPGDIRIERAGFGFYFPLTTCILISAIVSLILWLLRR